MKLTPHSSRPHERYSLIEPLEARIAPAAATVYLPSNPSFVTITTGSSLLVKAGQVLTSGSGGGGAYILYVAQGEVLVHTTDLNHNGSFDYNEVTGLSVGNGTILVSFVDIHGDVVTDLNPDGTLDDGGKGDILLDANITEIDLRSLTTSDFTGALSQSAAALVNDHLAISNYSIFGNIYAGGGLGSAKNPSSGLVIDSSGVTTQENVFTGDSGGAFYQPATPYIGSIYVGTAASGKPFNFGISGASTDIFGNLLAFNPQTGEAGASIYNVSAANTSEVFNIGTLQAGDGGFNAPGGSVANVALNGDTVGVVQLIAGNAGQGTVGQPGGSVLNFSATAVINSAVVLQSGNGGTGLTGAGGNAGQITLAPGTTAEINSHLILTYGNGGDGYTAGGAGGGTPSGSFVVPDGRLTTALDLVTTMHTIGSIGTNVPFDFNGDGYSDFVFSTANPNQVIVALGGNTTPNSTTSEFGVTVDAQHYLYLNAPAQVDSIVVGDFTGNGHPDIAVASGTGSYAGIYVYLSEYSPKTGQFEGFSAPLFSPLPSLEPYGYYYTSVPVTKLLAGDFTGTGVESLAVLAQETAFQTKDVYSVLIYLNGETNASHPGGSGYFYAATPTGGGLFQNFLPFADNAHFDPLHSIFEVTALQKFVPTPTNMGAVPSNGHDVIIEANLGSKTFDVIDDSSGFPGIISTTGFGKVDTNRQVGANYISSVNFQVLGIAVTEDATNPNIADIVALSQAPADFLVTLAGNGTPTGFTIQSGAGDQAGINFTSGSADPVSIYAVPNTAGTAISDVAILDYDGSGADAIYVVNLAANLSTGAISATQLWGLPSPANGRNINTVAWGVYYPHPVASSSIPGSGPSSFGFISADPLENYPDDQDFYVSQPFYTTTIGGLKVAAGGDSDTVVPFKVGALVFTAGTGGNSESGPGGAGGSFGQSLTVTGSGSTISGVGTLSIQFPADPTFEGLAILNAGQGGIGFSNGGAGGNIMGVSVVYETGATVLSGDAELIAGNGGQSLTATGGAGGSESQLYIRTGDFFEGGNGGIGVIGGAGGSILGNPQTGLVTSQTNNYDDYIAVFGGNGAPGVTGGGNGGTINYFTNDFLPIVGGIGGELIYEGGAGGDAVAGRGGTGGSVLNSSPSNIDNNLAGDIYLYAGSGGNGLSGGNGGNIINFVQASTISEPPTSFTIVAGFGGDATAGTGGAGGGISGVTVSASGLDVGYNRMVAGSGGNSSGGYGGQGGSLSNIVTASVAADTQNVAAAGAGGQGLLAGGAGGSDNNVSMDAGASAGSSSGKVVIIAGDGGASTSVAPTNPKNPLDVALSIGGVNGPGGNGGNIINFTQPTSTSTHVDLIAGNGGDTLSHSVIAGNATKDNSGKGGDIENVAVTGSIGNSDPTVPIISYNNIFTGITAGSNQIYTGTTMQDFVDNYILGGFGLPMDDSVGNVGLVAGAAGRVEGVTPTAATVASTDGVNGTVTNVHAENIMSMIAGNVDQVDLIQSLSNFGVIPGGILGANKTAYYDPVTNTTYPNEGTLGNLNYISTSGALVNTPLPGGGELIDGAIIAKNIPILESSRQF